MLTHPEIITFIKTLREDKPRLGKEKIKPLLDEFCREKGIQSISESTIGKVIKRHNLYSKLRRIYHNPLGRHRKKNLSYKKKVKHSPRGQEAGYVEIDTIVKFIHGIKLYILNAVDVSLKFQFSYGYPRLNSQNSTDFMRKLELMYPIQNGIHPVQTDNGLEFMGEFDEFNSRLIDYLMWHNTKRVHKSLGNVSPINHLLKILPPESQMYVTYTSSAFTQIRMLPNEGIVHSPEMLPTLQLTGESDNFSQ